MSPVKLETPWQNAVLTAEQILEIVDPLVFDDLPGPLKGESMKSYLDRNERSLSSINQLTVCVLKLLSEAIDDGNSAKLHRTIARLRSETRKTKPRRK